GQAGYDEYSAKFGDLSGVHIFAFSPQLKSLYKLAGVAVTRAGAMTIAELIENRLPAVLIPLPTAAENHQHYNALDLQHRGMAILLKQSELNGETLVQKVTQVWADHAGHVNKLGQLPHNTAAEDIAREILHDLDKEHKHAGKN
ncbi:MAG: undecaprenyldiphospho-muramoylpentapeptide beta-N-acetylglucosaminyltransferase, partial [Candidatus Cloacimonetes bacterium]|nr:undecaprenyldiphospho-muramoylpentapeptide beta-N-acetylglucosaminyltransferase [Candidatus Cloacimonadota bacterium]